VVVFLSQVLFLKYSHSHWVELSYISCAMFRAGSSSFWMRVGCSYRMLHIYWTEIASELDPLWTEGSDVIVNATNVIIQH
jgi:hypothetical protein